MSSPVSRRSEDYLRGIYEITRRKAFARIKDIAKELGVRPSTAVEMVRKLHREGFVVYEKYGGVTLTPRGKEIAEAVKERHETFRKLLEILLVPEDIALKDSHVLEHQLDPKTIQQFTRFVRFISEAPERPKFVKRWIEQFREYCRREADSS
ncbi:metal-dependent transcriptional regulator [Candidatus Bathyarchaeota archaeon]|nr:MAG: DtxR family iron (metal) dependent repressor [Candidatus Bathyarchaeota archaeon B24-2]RLG97727.1 MAG: metal-dependent transcriptional regulator [Candidatus Bathyarchaeota archaeon]RLI23425.1 MAG: metal-dependent transcriptional regulator [Candidatus Bathyarchaeota archaeon]